MCVYVSKNNGNKINLNLLIKSLKDISKNLELPIDLGYDKYCM